MTGFLKLIHSTETDELQEHYPNAFLLFIQISKTARRTPNGLDGLQVGDSIVGEKETSRKAGLSTKQYRNALDQLEKLKYIEVVYNPKWENNEKRAIKRAIKSKVVNVLNLRVCDYNPQVKGDQKGEQRANKGRSEGDKQEGIRKNKKEEETLTHEEIQKVVGGCDLILPIENSQEAKQPNRIIVKRSNGDHVEEISSKPSLTPPPSKINEPEPNKDEKKAYGKDGNVMLTISEYEDLITQMNEHERNYWIDQIRLEIGKKGVEAFNKKNMSHYHTILSWIQYRKEKNSSPKILPFIPARTPEENMIFAKLLEKHFKSKNYRIDICSTAIEFTPNSGQVLPEIIQYNSHGFKEQMENAIRKKGFVRTEIYERNQRDERRRM